MFSVQERWNQDNPEKSEEDGWNIIIFILYGSILFEKFVESLIENINRKPLPCSESSQASVEYWNP
jgi:hypothetical protein